MSKWKDFSLGDVVTFKTGKLNSNAAEQDGKYPFFTCSPEPLKINSYSFDQQAILLAGNNAEGNFHIKYYESKFDAYQRTYVFSARPSCHLKFLYYSIKLCLEDFKRISLGTATKFLTAKILNGFVISLPPLETQKKIAAVLSALDDKIELNNAINKNLEEQAQAIFKNMFPSVISNEISVGEYITPKRGKGLLVKDKNFGDVPVVAGGIEPATYHNESNTSAPVLTISASGANSGYVRLWNIPVWSSDSSFIDSSMTEDVYFWYVMLKLRQKEIFDSQMGTAQPHIYPKHIAQLPIKKLDEHRIEEFTK